jgi:glycosyltransferase involved in cell wall biosynthesis
MKVLHILPNIDGTTIPVEIASETDILSDTEVRMVSTSQLLNKLPDTVEQQQVLENLCGITDFSSFFNRIEEEFDIVHTHTVAEAAKAGYHAARRQIHHVNTQHGHLHYTTSEKLKNIPGLLFADTIIYNSESTANSYNILERQLKRRASEHTVHNGVDISSIEQYRATITTPPTIVTAARLIKRKNLKTLIRAVAHTDKMSLRIIGDGPHKGELQREARAANVESRVEFLGYLPEREDVYAELARGDVFVLPSHGEGFCVAVAEGMATGLPVVVSDIPIFHELVGDSGIFIDRRSPKSIATALTELFDDPEKAKQIGAQNRTRIFEHFTLRNCARGYRDVYKQSLGL